MQDRDQDDDSRPERSKAPWRCKDRTCGAMDCATCFPNTYHFATCEDEAEEETTDETEN